MKHILSNNNSMIFGFLLAICSLMGMYFIVFKPVSFSFHPPSRNEIGALPVPLKPIYDKQIKDEQSTEEEQHPIMLESQTVTQDEDLASLPINLPIRVQLNPPNSVNPTPIVPGPEIPIRINIPSIDLEAPIVPVKIEFTHLAGKEFIDWFVPEEYAVGWHTTSAKLGEPGNTVLNGHHNAYGEVFKHLVDVKEGDQIWVASEKNLYKYIITNKMILPEKYAQLDIRAKNAQWILPSVDERLTLITCWPYESNTHRLIVVAKPLSEEEITPNLK